MPGTFTVKDLIKKQDIFPEKPVMSQPWIGWLIAILIFALFLILGFKIIPDIIVWAKEGFKVNPF